MRFITEDELRGLYRQDPYTSYSLQPGERLTPGARQYLMDRGIKLYELADPVQAAAAAAAGVAAGGAAVAAAVKVVAPPPVSFDQLFIEKTGMTRQEMLIRVESLEKMCMSVAEELRMISSALSGASKEEEEEECQTTDL